MNKIKACIFDLDGVICDTAKYHFKAWRKLANELGFDFTEEENEKLKGVSRVESLNLILAWGGFEEHDEEVKTAMADKKNAWYLDFITHMSPDETLPGVKNFLDDLNPTSRQIIRAFVENGLHAARAEDHLQFERHGYFVADQFDSRPGAPVFNRTVTLKDSWGNTK